MPEGGALISWRDADGTQHVLNLSGHPAVVTIGRRVECGIALPGDPRVSRVHAKLERVDCDWTVCDDGLSRNGTWINDEPLRGTHRLLDGDRLKVGGTVLTVRMPEGPESPSTQGATGVADGPGVSRARVVVRLCGPLTVQVDGRRLEAGLSGRIGRRLFAYLIATRAHATRRDELTEILWPREQPASPEAGLSTHLARLRRLLGDQAITGRGQIRIELGPDAFVDVEAAETWTHQAQRKLDDGAADESMGAARAARRVLEQTFLPEFDDDAWVRQRRVELEGLVPELLEVEVRAALALGGAQLPAAEATARALVEQRPYHETGYQLLMRAHAERGNPAEALRVYERCRERLSGDLGVPPSAETRALHARLLDERSADERR